MKDYSLIVPEQNKREKATIVNKLDDQTLVDINTHIDSYDPEVSHHRHEHAPNRLYLPSTLSIATMHSLKK